MPENESASASAPAPRRRYRTRWSVVAFVVLALLVCLALIVWQLRDDEPPAEPDVAGTAAVGTVDGALRA